MYIHRVFQFRRQFLLRKVWVVVQRASKGLPCHMNQMFRKNRQKSLESGKLSQAIWNIQSLDLLKNPKARSKNTWALNHVNRTAKNISLYRLLMKKPPVMAGRMWRNCTQKECKYFKYTADTEVFI